MSVEKLLLIERAEKLTVQIANARKSVRASDSPTLKKDLARKIKLFQSVNQDIYIYENKNGYED